MENTEENKIIRKEFSKAFNWYEYKNTYGYSDRTKCYKEPTWAEIFIQIGRLLERNEINSNETTLKTTELLNP